MMLVCACDAGDDREGYVDRMVVSGGGSASNSSARGTLVKDQELIISFTNMSSGQLKFELCAELGDLLVYFSRTNTQPSEADNQFKLDTREAEGSRRCVRFASEATASCELPTLYSRVVGVGRLNRFRLKFSHKPLESVHISV